MNTLFLTLALFATFSHPINTGAQRAQAQEIAPIVIVMENEEEKNTTACVFEVPAPVLSDYLDGDTDTTTATADFEEDFQWWLNENPCN